MERDVLIEIGKIHKRLDKLEEQFNMLNHVAPMSDEVYPLINNTKSQLQYEIDKLNNELKINKKKVFEAEKLLRRDIYLTATSAIGILIAIIISILK